MGYVIRKANVRLPLGGPTAKKVKIGRVRLCQAINLAKEQNLAEIDRLEGEEKLTPEQANELRLNIEQTFSDGEKWANRSSLFKMTQQWRGVPLDPSDPDFEEKLHERTTEAQATMRELTS